METSSFRFIQSSRPMWFKRLNIAETLLHKDPEGARVKARAILEALIMEIGVERLRNQRLALHEFKAASLHEKITVLESQDWPDRIISLMHKIRVIGNSAAHPDRVGRRNHSDLELIRHHDQNPSLILEYIFDVLVHCKKDFDFENPSGPYAAPKQKEFIGTEELDELKADRRRLAEEQKTNMEMLEAKRQLGALWRDKYWGRGDKNTIQDQVVAFNETHFCEETERAIVKAMQMDPSEPLSGAGLSREESERINAQLNELERHTQMTKQMISDSRAEQERINDKLAIRERELAEREENLLKANSGWKQDFPRDDWSAIAEFLEERLRAGQSPFQEWLQPGPFPLGRGNFGEVFRCYPAGGGSPVAVKIPRAPHVHADSEALAVNWEMETRVADKLSGALSQSYFSGIVRPIEFGSDVPYVVYEYIDGSDLEHRLRSGPLNLLRSLHIVSEIAVTVGRLRDANIRFLDLAARNIMLNGIGQPILIDPVPCQAAEVQPPEWRGKNPRRITDTRLLSSGMVYMIGRLLLKLIGCPDWGAAPTDEISFLDFHEDYVESNSDDGIMNRVEKVISQSYESLDRSRYEIDHEKLIGLVFACVSASADERQMDSFTIPALAKEIRSCYDPKGLIGSIFAEA